MAYGQEGLPLEHIIPVDPAETLVAKGCYHYYRNGEKMPVVEPWSIHRQENGDLITRSERDSRSFGNQIRVHSVQSGPLMSSFKVQWDRFEEGAIKTVCADYRLDNGLLELNRIGIDGERQHNSQLLPAGCVVSPLMRIYTGAVIQQLVKAGKSPVLVPWIRDPEDTARLLEPLFSDREAFFQAEETLSLAGGQQQARRYEYFGGEYQPGTLFWLDQHDVLLRYRWQQDKNTLWETSLEVYQR